MPTTAMSSKPSKPAKPPLTPVASRSPSLSSHFAMIELKQRILTSVSKLSDRDTHQIAVDDLENIIQTLAADGIPMLLNSLYDAAGDNSGNKPAVKKESIRLLSFFCATHTVAGAGHLTKIITHIVKRLKDSDSGVRDACRESIGHLSSLYLKGEGAENNSGSLVSLFLKPLFDAMNEHNKVVQAGSAMCMAKMILMAADPPVIAFQKLCNRICKYLNNPNFLAKSALLPVISSLSQVGAISAHGLEPLLQCVHECLSSSDWSTRKAAADTLNVLGLYSSNLITGKANSTITALEACRFDKIKPVRDSITEALQQWKHIAGPSEDQRTPNHDSEGSEPAKQEKDVHAEGGEKTVVILKKKAPTLSDKELNPEFFQRLERRVSGEVEVIVPRRFLNSNPQNEVESKSKERDRPDDHGSSSRQRELSDKNDPSRREGYISQKGDWLAVQRQLLKLERQQANLMNMLQGFMGGSHDGMVTLENRVRGLERVIDDMSRGLSVSTTSRRSGGYMTGFEEPSSRSLGKYNGFSDYNNTRGLGSSWDYHMYVRNSQMGLRRAMDVRSPKRAGLVRFGEGPSARSVWQASKDEATLEAIRIAGEDNGPVRTARFDDNRNPIRTAWNNAMDALRAGDTDTAFAEVLSTGDDLVLVKLMDRTGPVSDQLSGEVGSEVLHAVAQFLQEPNLFDICLSWIQQLLDIILENKTEIWSLPTEVKMEILVNLNEACLTIEPPEDWEGMVPDQLLLRLASAWDIDLQHLDK